MRHMKCGLAVALVAAANVAGAQAATRSFTLGISGGASIPIGDYGDVVNTGFTVAGHLGFQPDAVPFGLRVDGMYHRYSFVNDNVDGSARIFGGTVNGMFMSRGNSASTVRPYASLGVGLYNVGGSVEVGSVDVSDSETKFGLNGGVGLDFRLGTLGTFAEVRYHAIFTDESNTGIIPIVFGVRF